ncbi:hypothetical protein Cob_v011603 [Colletotrichum orbiculare MAFF 240422]|uniref:Uncharacterized protein n=1 Tax=Colletotrichum orbiculare (strain 104-T / ATCC 96160 / CBS 514.97 / LARS 414 / MAFF 240422) TaxID=1213857 RepID=A0A484FAN9_COLOR|nr:hypothetical protein Cob_v011603 [Colletotrichum orbiculare MAFF 240422]
MEIKLQESNAALTDLQAKRPAEESDIVVSLQADIYTLREKSSQDTRDKNKAEDELERRQADFKRRDDEYHREMNRMEDMCASRDKEIAELNQTVEDLREKLMEEKRTVMALRKAEPTFLVDGQNLPKKEYAKLLDNRRAQVEDLEYRLQESNSDRDYFNGLSVAEVQSVFESILKSFGLLTEEAVSGYLSAEEAENLDLEWLARSAGELSSYTRAMVVDGTAMAPSNASSPGLRNIRGERVSDLQKSLAADMEEESPLSASVNLKDELEEARSSRSNSEASETHFTSAGDGAVSAVDHESALAEVKAHRDEALREVEELKLSADKQQQIVLGLQQNVKDTKASVQELRRQLAKSSHDNTQIRTSLEDGQEMLETRKAEIRHQNTLLNRADAECRRLQAELGKAEGDLEVWQSIGDTVGKENKELKARIKDMESELTAKQSTVALLAEQLKRAQSHNDAAKEGARQVDEAQAEVERLQLTIERLTEQLSQAEAKERRLAEHEKDLNKRLSDARSEIAEHTSHERDVAAKDQLLADSEAGREKLQRRVVELEIQLEESAAAVSTAKFDMKKEKDRRVEQEERGLWTGTIEQALKQKESQIESLKIDIESGWQNLREKNAEIQKLRNKLGDTQDTLEAARNQLQRQKQPRGEVEDPKVVLEDAQTQTERPVEIDRDPAEHQSTLESALAEAQEAAGASRRELEELWATHEAVQTRSREDSESATRLREAQNARETAESQAREAENRLRETEAQLEDNKKQLADAELEVEGYKVALVNARLERRLDAVAHEKTLKEAEKASKEITKALNEAQRARDETHEVLEETRQALNEAILAAKGEASGPRDNNIVMPMDELDALIGLLRLDKAIFDDLLQTGQAASTNETAETSPSSQTSWEEDVRDHDTVPDLRRLLYEGKYMEARNWMADLRNRKNAMWHDKHNLLRRHRRAIDRRDSLDAQVQAIDAGGGSGDRETIFQEMRAIDAVLEPIFNELDKRAEAVERMIRFHGQRFNSLLRGLGNPPPGPALRRPAVENAPATSPTAGDVPEPPLPPEPTRPEIAAFGGELGWYAFPGVQRGPDETPRSNFDREIAEYAPRSFQDRVDHVLHLINQVQVNTEACAAQNVTIRSFRQSAAADFLDDDNMSIPSDGSASSSGVDSNASSATGNPNTGAAVRVFPLDVSEAWGQMDRNLDALPPLLEDLFMGVEGLARAGVNVDNYDRLQTRCNQLALELEEIDGEQQINEPIENEADLRGQIHNLQDEVERIEETNRNLTEALTNAGRETIPHLNEGAETNNQETTDGVNKESASLGQEARIRDLEAQVRAANERMREMQEASLLADKDLVTKRAEAATLHHQLRQVRSDLAKAKTDFERDRIELTSSLDATVQACVEEALATQEAAQQTAMNDYQAIVDSLQAANRRITELQSEVNRHLRTENGPTEVNKMRIMELENDLALAQQKNDEYHTLIVTLRQDLQRAADMEDEAQVWAVRDALLRHAHNRVGFPDPGFSDDEDDDDDDDAGPASGGNGDSGMSGEQREFEKRLRDQLRDSQKQRRRDIRSFQQQKEELRRELQEEHKKALEAVREVLAKTEAELALAQENRTSLVARVEELEEQLRALEEDYLGGAIQETTSGEEVEQVPAISDEGDGHRGPEKEVGDVPVTAEAERDAVTGMMKAGLDNAAHEADYPPKTQETQPETKGTSKPAKDLGAADGGSRLMGRPNTEKMAKNRKVVLEAQPNTTKPASGQRGQAEGEEQQDRRAKTEKMAGERVVVREPRPDMMAPDGKMEEGHYVMRIFWAIYRCIMSHLISWMVMGRFALACLAHVPVGDQVPSPKHAAVFIVDVFWLVGFWTVFRALVSALSAKEMWEYANGLTRGYYVDTQLNPEVHNKWWLGIDSRFLPGLSQLTGRSAAALLQSILKAMLTETSSRPAW